jgi:hypothetical protein
MHGMPWPVDELKRRPREAVLAALWNRLGNRRFRGEYRDAFAVYALRHLRPDDLAARLLRVYPELDDAGRYEVLLYGFEYEVASYAPLFVGVLERKDPARVEMRDLMAALFAIRVPSESLLPGLRALEQRIAAEDLKGPYFSVDGFPYSDVRQHGVGDPRAAVLRALARIESTVRAGRCPPRRRRCWRACAPRCAVPRGGRS